MSLRAAVHVSPARALGLACLSWVLPGASGWAQVSAPGAARGSSVLHQLDSAVAGLAARVAPAVVQIEVSGFGLTAEPRHEDTAFVSRQHGIGSGVIVDPSGYILTNHHVIRGAQRITVILGTPGGPRRGAADATARRMFSARLVGFDPGVDLALLKIDATGLSHLPLDGAVRVRQGELVFAIGSPQGLSSTLTMGIVGAPARQVEFGAPIAYIQTDAPINPGNSGGPLINVDGALVGINTFILSQSGGSQGLGFAIPVEVVKVVFESLRAHGHVHRIDTGVTTQAITPRLAAGLGLQRDWGVVVCDVASGGAAWKAGLLVGDVLDSLDGHPLDSLASLSSAVLLHLQGTPVALVLYRGATRLALQVYAPEAVQPADQLVDLAKPEEGLVRKLGIVGLELSSQLARILPPLLISTGVVVAARTLDGTSIETGLQAGDVIHAVNRTEVYTVDALRRALAELAPGTAAVLQIEHQGKLAYLAFDME